MIKKVVYLFYTHVYDFEYDKYGLLLMKKKGLQVAAWSLKSVFYPQLKKENNMDINGIPTLYINDWMYFIKNVISQKKRETMFILQLPVHSKETSLSQIIIRICGFKYCMLYPQPYLCESTIGKLKYSKLNKIWWENFVNIIFPATYNFLGTKVNFLDFSSKYMVKKKNNILIHTLDYDKYLKKKDENRIIKQKYILFLDEYEPFHPEHEFLGSINVCKNPEEYYSQLNKLFAIIEDNTGLEVVIAEHPRADYSDKEHYLYGRKHYRNETFRLVKDCEWVITSCSLAQDYIVLFDKPFLLINESNKKNSVDWKRVYIPYMKMFNCRSLDYYGEIDWNVIQTYISHNIMEYKNFYKRFIKSNLREDRLFFEVVYDKIKNI